MPGTSPKRLTHAQKEHANLMQKGPIRPVDSNHYDTINTAAMQYYKL